jgi:predicted amidohydrolase
MMTKSIRVSLAQANPVLHDRSANLEKAEQYMRMAAGEGAELILFPELFLTGYTLGDKAFALATAPNEPPISRLLALSKSHHLTVMMGYVELDPRTHKVYDSLLISDRSGELIGSYRKIHLYGEEKKWVSAGTNPCVFDFGLGRIGPMICYDLEFPEMARVLALKGAQWLAISTGNMLPNQHMQEIYAQARALENRCTVVLCNRVGKEGKLTFFGNSIVVDPFGRIVAKSGSEETLLTVEIDLSLNIQAIQADTDYFRDRQPAAYGDLTFQGGDGYSGIRQ